MDYEGNGIAREDGRKRPGARCTGSRPAATRARCSSATASPTSSEEDAIPFAAMTPVIVTHRFFGRSIADLVMDIQRIKTALLRALLDNAYLANNPRTEVAESHATETTLDDLLVSRPGRDRAHQDAGRPRRHQASRYRRPCLSAAAIPGRHAGMAHRA